MDEKNKHSYTYQHFAEQEEVEELEGGCVWIGWDMGGGGGGFLKADTESEMEHVAYREISVECSLMNVPLYPCYSGKKETV